MIQITLEVVTKIKENYPEEDYCTILDRISKTLLKSRDTETVEEAFKQVIQREKELEEYKKKDPAAYSMFLRYG